MKRRKLNEWEFEHVHASIERKHIHKFHVDV